MFTVVTCFYNSEIEYVVGWTPLVKKVHNDLSQPFGGTQVLKERMWAIRDSWLNIKFTFQLTRIIQCKLEKNCQNCIRHPSLINSPCLINALIWEYSKILGINKNEQNHLIHSVSCRLINKGLPISSCSICQIQRKNRLTMVTQ